MEFTADDVKKAFSKAKKDIGKVNILLVGKTGVGKSTLINAFFGEDLAETGIGRPVTQNCREYTKEDSFVRLFDTKGIEIKDYKIILQELKGLINSRKTDNEADHIHLAWFCIQSESKRFEDAEINLLNELAEQIPVVVVLTQCLSQKVADQLKSEILEGAPFVKQVVKVLAKDYESDLGVHPAFGLDTLEDVSEQLIPEAFRKAFAAAQKVSLEAKKRNAHLIVTAGAASAAAACAVPIPFSDAVALAPIQVVMLAKINQVMGLKSSGDFLKSLVLIAGSVGGATYLGRTLFATIMKFIPGAGSAIGSTVSATTAAAVTTAMGEAYISALVFMIAANIDMSPENIGEYFKKALRKEKLGENSPSKTP